MLIGIICFKGPKRLTDATDSRQSTLCSRQNTPDDQGGWETTPRFRRPRIARERFGLFFSFFSLYVTRLTKSWYCHPCTFGQMAYRPVTLSFLIAQGHQCICAASQKFCLYGPQALSGLACDPVAINKRNKGVGREAWLSFYPGGSIPQQPTPTTPPPCA